MDTTRRRLPARRGVFARIKALPPNEIPDHEEFVATVRSQLGEESYSAARARGAAMTYEQITTSRLRPWSTYDSPSNSVRARTTCRAPLGMRRGPAKLDSRGRLSSAVRQLDRRYRSRPGAAVLAVEQHAVPN
jgi:hypothetical protein